jgi:hypothetical protein
VGDRVAEEVGIGPPVEAEEEAVAATVGVETEAVAWKILHAAGPMILMK